ncbi:MAG: hypothetical protein KatS3mg053_1307 [Candidatus Roseilinea sp.]|nr:MAG: hypothetical protein KatS3mg053_1307 [Candidatus Roseilinea sp.]
MGEPEVIAWLTHLAKERDVAASIQNQALSAVLFLYRHVLQRPLDLTIEDGVWAQKPARLPTVLTRDEALRVIACLHSEFALMAKLLYGCGLRLNECVGLRVQDIDFQRRQIIVRDAKGDQDRVTMLPAALVAPLQEHLTRVQAVHRRDLQRGFGFVDLPEALALAGQRLKLDPENFNVLLALASMHRHLGDAAASARFAAQARARIPPDDHYNLVCLESVCGDADAAFDHLRLAAADPACDRDWARQDPDFEWIREDARFEEIVG